MEEEDRREESEGDVSTEECQRDSTLLALMMEEGGHEPRNVGRL